MSIIKKTLLICLLTASVSMEATSLLSTIARRAVNTVKTTGPLALFITGSALSGASFAGRFLKTNKIDGTINTDRMTSLDPKDIDGDIFLAGLGLTSLAASAYFKQESISRIGKDACSSIYKNCWKLFPGYMGSPNKVKSGAFAFLAIITTLSMKLGSK